MSKTHKPPQPISPSAPRPGRNMWLWVGLVAVGAMLLTIATLTLRKDSPDNAATEFQGGPRVAVNQDKFDYGDVKVNTPIETMFRVRNTGDQPLQIAGNPKVELVQGC